jgi:predicted 3-demethylubiquinone-9 3-methyltransferase (glyoxalase superfamily)
VNLFFVPVEAMSKSAGLQRHMSEHGRRAAQAGGRAGVHPDHTSRRKQTMASKMQRISPFFWFDHQAEEAAKFYTSIFPNSSIDKVTRYTPESAAVAGEEHVGKVMTIDFTLDGQHFAALNGGPIFKFTEALSLVIHCDTQEEVDHYWNALTEGGDPKAQQCGWLKDKFGVSWQVVPGALFEVLGDPDPARARRATAAMMTMKKIDVAALRRAAAGE